MTENIISVLPYFFILSWPFIAYTLFEEYFNDKRFGLYLVCRFPMAPSLQCAASPVPIRSIIVKRFRDFPGRAVGDALFHPYNFSSNKAAC